MNKLPFNTTSTRRGRPWSAQEYRAKFRARSRADHGLPLQRMIYYFLLGVVMTGFIYTTAHADINPALCVQLAQAAPSSMSQSKCSSIAPTLQACVSNNLIAQAYVSSTDSLLSQMQAIAQVANVLTQIDYQCNYYNAGGPSV